MKLSFRLIFGLAQTCAVGVVVLMSGGEASAQIFCPSTIPGQAGIILQGGTCTNGTTGAYSNAALASQALSDLSESTTQETARTTNAAIADRRQVEAERCPDGLERVNGVCQRPPVSPTVAPVSRPPAQSSKKEAARATKHRGQPPKAEPPTLVYKAPVIPYIDEGVHLATWARAFGDYERRTGSGTSSINCCQAVVGGGIPIPLTLSATSDSRTYGFVGGLDFTRHNLFGPGDGLIAGFLLGYAETNLSLSTTSISSSPGNLSNGASSLRAQLYGPSVGAFATYYNGGFSIDNTFKTDFFHLNESFTDSLAFTANLGVNPTSATFSSGGSTDLVSYNSFGNVNYRFQVSDRLWIEPTVGYNYTSTHYESAAALLGLSDGYLLRAQGGARFGADSYWNDVRVTTVVTGLAYDDVIVHGGVIENAAFGTATNLLLAGEGKVRGQGVFAVNFDYGRGLSSFVLANVRGGDGLFGAGGSAGIRYQW
ncbi:autotransporter outer membrane beta-barrel domain-containing protein [Bradyrhizobium jicamae]|uniref:Autotransporter outer membrane beta-barrel domain-containing protein n=1 Tax=Bradyrhizobium jicamae TaxID=280332 RepID=A0ABS5FRF3_9BRAD|nr:autotransporter outer membrane beta-barrel domain-containing protein [Bradyrhizobium jicamae]MBR0799373.1 autotransporter outer membrane beta-barrel domain-containing protein [Bradyrhizobium jicamae]